jgi:Protein of unknown function (DUF1749)
VRVVALQAPVSDRESGTTAIMAQDGDDANSLATKLAQNLAHAKDLVATGKGEEMMPRAALWAPITARRYVDLTEFGGMDDFFSSDFTDVEMAAKLGHIGRLPHLQAVLVATSGADEFIPDNIDAQILTMRLVSAMNNHYHDNPGASSIARSTRQQQKKGVARALYLPNANHNLSSSPKDADAFVQAVASIWAEAATGKC